jgi:hypothetical protein
LQSLKTEESARPPPPSLSRRLHLQRGRVSVGAQGWGARGRASFTLTRQAAERCRPVGSRVEGFGKEQPEVAGLGHSMARHHCQSSAQVWRRLLRPGQPLPAQLCNACQGSRWPGSPSSLGGIRGAVWQGSGPELVAPTSEVVAQSPRAGQGFLFCSGAGASTSASRMLRTCWGGGRGLAEFLAEVARWADPGGGGPGWDVGEEGEGGWLPLVPAGLEPWQPVLSVKGGWR